ncbi:MAG: hypothetical protein ACLPW4_06740, partial [Candidatus Sulfotelmatobacter sp.]
GRHLLLTGDLDQLGLVELVAQAQPEPIDLMLAPHHGGKSANTGMLYTWARTPSISEFVMHTGGSQPARSQSGSYLVAKKPAGTPPPGSGAAPGSEISSGMPDVRPHIGP